MVVLPLLDAGADGLTVDAEFDDDASDDEELDDGLEAAGDVDEVVLDEVLVVWPA